MKANIKPLFNSKDLRQYGKGQVVIHEGDELDRVYYIQNGFVKMYNIREDGEVQLLTIYGPDEAFPLSILFDAEAKQSSYYFEAMSDVDLLFQNREALAAKVSDNNNALHVYIEYSRRNSKELTQRLEMLELKSAKQKVALVLPYLMEKCGDDTKNGQCQLLLRLTHADIAEMVGITRETASIQIKELEKEKVLNQTRGTWIINTKLLNDKYLS